MEVRAKIGRPLLPKGSAVRFGPRGRRAARLATLISEHSGGASRATADHVERFCVTREVGGSRWEPSRM